LITHPEGAVAVNVVLVALLHAVTLPPEFGAAGRALTVMETVWEEGQLVFVLVADTV
jgi:Zn-dependent membrane protease YugP